MILPLAASCWSISSSEIKKTRLFSLGETFANIDIHNDYASCWSIGSLAREQKITWLFSLDENFANLRFVWFALI